MSETEHSPLIAAAGFLLALAACGFLAFVAVLMGIGIGKLVQLVAPA